MDFLRPEFEEAIEPVIDGYDVITIGRFSYTGADVLKLAGEDAYKQAFNDWIWEEWIPGRRDRKEEILKLHANKARFDGLKQIIKSGSAIPFVGSGMSCSTGMPTWAKFLRDTRKQTSGFTAVQLERLLSSGDYEIAASRVFGGMPRQLFNERFEGNFSLKSDQRIKGPVRLLPLLFHSIAITTNFDGILEGVYGNCDRTFQVILHGTAVGDFRKKVVAGTKCLLKLHGNFAETHGRVLLKDEYDSFYQPGCGGREELALIFRHGGLVFMGCSLLQDRTMVLLKEIADSDRNMPRHYAFLKMPESPNKMRMREHFLSERNIFPIWYDGEHDADIEALLVGLMEELNKF